VVIIKPTEAGFGLGKVNHA